MFPVVRAAMFVALAAFAASCGMGVGDDGPFRGTFVGQIVNAEPLQSFPVDDSLTLEVYQPKEGETDAYVQMRHRLGTVIWTVRADGCRNLVFRKVVPEGHRYLVEGSVGYPGDVEVLRWYVAKNGAHRVYFYSW